MSVQRVVLTGSECTGKTTLAVSLARRLRVPWSGEFVREYAAQLGRAITLDDVPRIAEGQVAGEDRAIRRARRLAVHDTDLLSTVVYSRHYFGRCPAEVEQSLGQRRADLYLLHHPDVPWIAEAGMRDRPHGREEMHALFAAALVAMGARVVDVRGSWDERSHLAERAVRELLSEGEPSA